MSDLRFSVRFPTWPLLLAERAEAGASLLDAELLFTVGYFDEAAAPTEPLPLTEAWESQSGHLCLFGAVPQTPSIVAEGIAGLHLERQDEVLWIADPNRAPGDWVWARLAVDREGAARVLKNTVRLLVTGDPEGFFFELPAGSVLTLDAAAEVLRVVGADRPLGFGRGEAVLPVDAEGLEIALGPSMGFALRAGTVLPADGQLGRWCDRLGLGIWIGHDDAQNGPGALRFAVFTDNEHHAGLRLAVQITPAALFDQAASAITAEVLDAPGARYVSWFRTLLGRSVTLQPQSGRFAMVFTDLGHMGLGLIPAGRFSVQISDQVRSGFAQGAALGEGRRLACGASGTESVLIPDTAKASLAIEFVPGQPGFAGGGVPALSERMRTAWLRLSASEPLQYFAQPPGPAALFDAAHPEGTADVPLLDHLPMTASVLEAGDNAPLLPWVPLAGVDGARRDAALALEDTAIGPLRKAILSAQGRARVAAGIAAPRSLPAGLLNEDEPSLTAITPNGLEVQVSQTESGERWDHVGIARLLSTLPGNRGMLRFAGEDGVIDPLKSALLTSQQFIVISDPAAVAPFFSGDDARIALRNWVFDLDPGTWARRGTILIVKNTNLPMQHLISDTGSWTEAEAFNRTPAATAKRLETIASEARAALARGRQRMAKMRGPDEDTPGHDLAFFVEQVLDAPDWNGFLFLNASIESYPDDLAGMRAGVRGDGLFAHHLGVAQTPFVSLSDLQENSSSMFGLIRYADTAPAIGNGGFFDFRVRDLGVLFRNSDIRNFRALIELSMGPLFGQQARLKDNGPPVCLLEGVRHLRGKTDSYTFEAVETRDLHFGTGPLQMMRLEQAEFLTVEVDADPAGQTRTLFRFAGFLRFDDVTSQGKRFDLFSFDQLGFGGLVVRMDFANAEPLKPAYAFKTDAMALSEAQSVARAGSLFNGFPLKFDRIVAEHGKDVTGAGAMTVSLPHVPARLPSSWYGLSMFLDMGTLSDVAGAAGLKAGLLLAWGPDAGQVFVGLDLSGAGLSGSGTELSLLGVLKLKLHALSLREQDGKWLLMLHGMTMGVFSKTLPPGGNFDFYLFGNPDPSGSSHSLGWYGAWVKERKTDETAAPLPDRLASCTEAIDLPRLITAARLGNRDMRHLQGDD